MYTMIPGLCEHVPRPGLMNPIISASYLRAKRLQLTPARPGLHNYIAVRIQQAHQTHMQHPMHKRRGEVRTVECPYLTGISVRVEQIAAWASLATSTTCHIEEPMNLALP